MGFIHQILTASANCSCMFSKLRYMCSTEPSFASSFFRGWPHSLSYCFQALLSGAFPSLESPSVLGDLDDPADNLKHADTDAVNWLVYASLRHGQKLAQRLTTVPSLLGLVMPLMPTCWWLLHMLALNSTSLCLVSQDLRSHPSPRSGGSQALWRARMMTTVITRMMTREW